MRRLQGEFDDPQERSTQLAAPTTAEAAADAACRKCSGHVGSMHGVTGKVRRPKGWRKDCIACLEADWPLGDLYHAESLPGGSGDADDENDEGAELQAVVAGTLAYALFVDKGLPFSKSVTVDTSDVPSTPDAGMSRACVSCVSNWVLDESMDVADEFDLVVHCHMCLHEHKDAAAEGDPSSERMQDVIWFALASRYVGQFVKAPVSRKGGAGSADGIQGLLGSNAAAVGRRRSIKHNKQLKQRPLQAAEYGFDQQEAGLFSWVESAWFQRWGWTLLSLAVGLFLFADLWISWHDSCLFGVARKLGLLREGAPAADEPAGRGRKAAARGASREADNQQQRQQQRQQPGKAGKQGNKKQVAKGDRRQSSHQISNSKPAASRERSIAASSSNSNSSSSSSRDTGVDTLPHQPTVKASSGPGDSDIQQPQHQQQQQQAAGQQHPNWCRQCFRADRRACYLTTAGASSSIHSCSIHGRCCQHTTWGKAS